MAPFKFNPDVEQLTDGEVISGPIHVMSTLSSVHNIRRGSQAHAPMIVLRPGDDPWVDWANQNEANYVELWNYGMDLVDEHYKRFGSKQPYPYKHGCALPLDRLGDVPPLPEGELTPRPA